MNTVTSDIEKFIAKFNEGNQDIINFFMNGKCYWFAKVLQERFDSGNILYNEIDGHFVYYYPASWEDENYGVNLYDIRGRMKFNNKGELLEYMRKCINFEYMKSVDKSHYDRLIRDCVNFED